jgi:hypothetical protein
MPGRMPVLGEHYLSETPGESIDDRHHPIAVGHGEIAAGAEVVLHVDHQEHVAVAWDDRHIRLRRWSEFLPLTLTLSP